MTAKIPATKTKAAPAKARRVVKKAASPALDQAAALAVDHSAEQVALAAADPAPAPAEPITPTQARPRGLVAPILAAFTKKELNMATVIETTTETVRATASKLNGQAETAINSGKAAMEQVAAKSKEAVEAGMKSMDELASMHRGNIDALIASAKAATTGVEQVMTHLTEASKKSFEDTTAMVKTLASAKTPNELIQLQSEFAKTQFDEAVAQYSKMTEMMIKLAGEVIEPVQNRVALATDKLKSAWSSK